MPTELNVNQPGERLDRYLTEQLPERSRAEIQRWIKEGAVLVNQRPAKPSQRLNPGDSISVTIPAPAPTTVEPEAIPLTILYEDDDLIAVDKPAGMVVHPAPGHETGTLVNAILHHCPDLQGVGGVQRPGIVHRLDKDTSGIILVAKHDRAHRHLQAQFKNRTIDKTYLALLIGQLEQREGRIDAPIGRHPRQRKRMAVTSAEKGREAITEFTVEAYYGTTTLVAAHPLTGRTHQIRVHFASIGHPLVGDVVYGPRRDAYKLGRHFLHAHRLHFLRPADDASLDLVSPLPPDLQALLDRLSPK
ncbi:MAG TPA: RluA family pseudouridine synthase [Caldilineae bacterium]|nr:RluA family pseudouridine synthase [Caldilineae bacterium]